MRCLQRILNITWQDKVPNNTVLERAEIPSMCIHYWNRDLSAGLAMWWEWIPKDLLYGELAQESAPLAGPKYAIKMFARRTWRLWTLTSTDGKPWLQNGQIRSGQFALQSLKRHLTNGLRQRDKRGRPEAREIDQRLTTLGAPREPPIRVQYHSLSKLKDANIIVCQLH